VTQKHKKRRISKVLKMG